jgi:hypothetical protein
MNDQQLYFAIGIPLVANMFMFLVASIANNRAIDSLRREMDARFEAMNQALLRVEGVIDARLNNVEKRLEALERH